ncbi:hypothetical protein HNR23_002288 [Nocardiopsis mwathae]|uniref:Uncharacterized protein n=1 Tax=Nocardiopsis mwathae TaxID=1472723 RepID=A0A7W9YHI8_9ACTN|nr:hypothetical protein [Nocardiopsis mwathae]MBB6172228.1 hypothetical protein [Nocardiopsis mwathae]
MAWPGPTDHLYDQIESALRDVLDGTQEQWRTADRDDLIKALMIRMRAGLEAPFANRDVQGALDTVRHHAEVGMPIRIDDRGPYYHLITTDTPAPPKTTEEGRIIGEPAISDAARVVAEAARTGTPVAADGKWWRLVPQNPTA